jgi:hypothetical protein
MVLSEEPPTPAEFIDLRARAGWGRIDEATAQRSLQAAAFSVSLRRDDRLVGFARVMGDGVLYFFLADVVIDPEFRGGGHGDALMRRLPVTSIEPPSRAPPSRLSPCRAASPFMSASASFVVRVVRSGSACTILGHRRTSRSEHGWVF